MNGRRYFVTTFGCQMNAHDSERIKGMLEELGLGEATSQDEADVIAYTDHGGPFVAAVARGNVAGMQFHPEKSGETGLKILKNFLEL